MTEPLHPDEEQDRPEGFETKALKPYEILPDSSATDVPASEASTRILRLPTGPDRFIPLHQSVGTAGRRRKIEQMVGPRQTGRIRSMFQLGEATHEAVVESFRETPVMAPGQALVPYMPLSVLERSGILPNLVELGIDGRLAWDIESYFAYLFPPNPSGMTQQELSKRPPVKMNRYHVAAGGLQLHVFPPTQYSNVRLTHIPKASSATLTRKLIYLKQLLFWKESEMTLEEAEHLAFRLADSFAVRSELGLVMGDLFYGLEVDDFFSQHGGLSAYSQASSRIKNASQILREQAETDFLCKTEIEKVLRKTEFLDEIAKLFWDGRRDAYVMKTINAGPKGMSKFDITRQRAELVFDGYFENNADPRAYYQMRERKKVGYMTEAPDIRIIMAEDRNQYAREMSGWGSIRRELSLTLTEALMKGILGRQPLLRVTSLQESGSFSELLRMYTEALKSHLALLTFEEGTGRPQLSEYLDLEFRKKA